MKRYIKPLLFLGLLLLAVTAFIIFKNDKANAPESIKATSKPIISTGPVPTKSSSASFDKTRHSLTDPKSIWVVVNKQNPLSPLNYAPADLVAVGNGQYMRSEAARNLASMYADAVKHGLVLTSLSGYRSYGTQVAVYGNEVKSYGQTIADRESARPGFSEHQTGLAIDVGGGGCNITDCFANTEQGKWLAANAYRYGFIIRYPQNKENVTGYRFEPWHVRYIVTDLSNEMHKQGVETLEEFFRLPAATSY